eukprot:GHVT01029895.1.p1 GENE.GHVT01029895.1~~GHVT01029895.1.p1  ORF type:complete len:151 (+),score=26.73 GHVT01029895.1:237-689(+)
MASVASLNVGSSSSTQGDVAREETPPPNEEGVDANSAKLIPIPAEDLDKMTNEELIDRILELQKTLSRLSEEVEEVRSDTKAISSENEVMRLYISNLTQKMTSMPNLGTRPPTAIPLPRQASPGLPAAVPIHVNPHLGELAFPISESDGI